MKISESPDLPWSRGAPQLLPANNPLLGFVEEEGLRALKSSSAAARAELGGVVGVAERAVHEARRGEALGTAGCAWVAGRTVMISGAAALVVAEAARGAYETVSARSGSVASRAAAYPAELERRLARTDRRLFRRALLASACTGIPAAAATVGAVAGSVTVGPTVALVLAQTELARGARRLWSGRG